MRYFKHEVNAHKDARIMALRSTFGGAAVDAYWAIVEIMHEEQRAFPYDCSDYQYKAMSVYLMVDKDTLCEWVREMVDIGLFDLTEDNYVISHRAEKNWEGYKAQVESGRKGGKKSGETRREKGSYESLEGYSKGSLENPSTKTKTKEGITYTCNTHPMADGGAEADKSAPCCQKCGAEMRLDARLKKTTRWWCSTCDSMEVIPNV